MDFARSWTEYESGFGDLSGEHWLGKIPTKAHKRYAKKCELAVETLHNIFFWWLVVIQIVYMC